jgi:polyphosphate kinase
VVELRARFDEAANIELASHLQDAGAHVVYGVVGYKTHAKMTMIVRRHKGRVRRYVHLGTGNYHAGTARNYTDFGLFTADKVIGEDVHKIFQQLTGLGRVSRPKKLLQAPFNLHKGILSRIGREATAAQEGRPARIIARMNALIDPQIIQALYQASQAGVSIDLIVRGVCCLRPGVPGVSENIRVRSVLGRFLEHSRVFYFHNDGGEPEVFCSSADWMPRNFFRRVESAFPIEDRRLAQRVYNEGLELYLKDNVQAWVLQPDGSYQRAGGDRGKSRSAQGLLLQKINGVE